MPSNCMYDSECKSSQFCSPDGWRCREKKAPGEDCHFMTECQAGYACKWGICTSKGSNSFSSQNSPLEKPDQKNKRDCTDDSMCKTGHYCSKENRKCERQLALFSRCSYDSQCEQPFVCQENACQLKYQATIIKVAAFVTCAIIVGMVLFLVILGVIGYLIWSRRNKIQRMYLR